MDLPKLIYIVVSKRAKTPIDFGADCRNDVEDARRLARRRNRAKTCRCTDWVVVAIDTRCNETVAEEAA